MKIEDIKVGESYRYGGLSWSTQEFTENKYASPVTVLFVGKQGAYVTDAEGDEVTVEADELEPIPPIVKRYVVELRLPKDGERYFYVRDVFTASGTFHADARRPVIVEEL